MTSEEVLAAVTAELAGTCFDVAGLDGEMNGMPVVVIHLNSDGVPLSGWTIAMANAGRALHERGIKCALAKRDRPTKAGE